MGREGSPSPSPSPSSRFGTHNNGRRYHYYSSREYCKARGAGARSTAAADRPLHVAKTKSRLLRSEGRNQSLENNTQRNGERHIGSDLGRPPEMQRASRLASSAASVSAAAADGRIAQSVSTLTRLLDSSTRIH